MDGNAHVSPYLKTLYCTWYLVHINLRYSYVKVKVSLHKYIMSYDRLRTHDLW